MWKYSAKKDYGDRLVEIVEKLRSGETSLEAFKAEKEENSNNKKSSKKTRSTSSSQDTSFIDQMREALLKQGISIEGDFEKSFNSFKGGLADFLANSIANLLQQLCKLTSENAYLAQENTALRNSNLILFRRVAELEQCLQFAENADRLQDTIKDLQDTVQNLEASNASLLHSLDQQNNRNGRLQTEFQSFLINIADEDDVETIKNLITQKLGSLRTFSALIEYPNSVSRYLS